MDDLILWIAYDKNNRHSFLQAEAIKSTELTKDSTYKGGLELEEQPYTRLNEDTTKHDFSGTHIYVVQPGGKFFFMFCTPLNKNLDEIRNFGRQKYPRFIPKLSMVPTHYIHRYPHLLGLMINLIIQIF